MSSQIGAYALKWGLFEDAIDGVHRRCLRDEAFAKNTVNCVAEIPFDSENNNHILLIRQFLTILQTDFKKCKQIKAETPAAFRNMVMMLGEYNYKGNFGNSIIRYNFIAPALLTYLEMLLEFEDEENLKLFTIQFHKNGKFLDASYPADVLKLMAKIRKLMSICRDRKSSLWLLLAVDIAMYNFRPLPIVCQRFYFEKLGPVVVEELQFLPNKTNNKVPSNIAITGSTANSAAETAPEPAVPESMVDNDVDDTVTLSAVTSSTSSGMFKHDEVVEAMVEPRQIETDLKRKLSDSQFTSAEKKFKPNYVAEGMLKRRMESDHADTSSQKKSRPDELMDLD